MSLSVPPLTSTPHSCWSGDVMVHESAAIAPGVWLQAEPGSRLVIGAGVCIGAGAVLHAWGGDLVMESEVTIGAGVLIAGQGTIGQRACIGAKATLWNCAVAPGEAIAPHSLMAEELPPAPLEATQEIPQATPQENPSAPSTDSERPPSEPSLGTSQNSSPSEPSGEETKGQLDTRPSSGAIKQVYGQAYFERMMLSLFPHRRSNDSSQNGTGNGEEG